MAFSDGEDRCALPSLVTRASLTFRKMTIFFAGGLSLTFLGAGASEGNGTRMYGRDSLGDKAKTLCQPPPPFSQL